MQRNKIKEYSGDKHYSEIYKDKSYVNLRIQNAEKLISELSSLKLFKKNARVLDIGCGTGEIDTIIKNTFESIVYGLDINKIAVEKARQNGVVAKIGNVEQEWPFNNSSMDSVLCIQMIEHLVNPDFFLQESKRVLKKNGTVVITTPNLAAWFNRLLLFLGYQPFYTEVSTIDKTLGLSFTKGMTRNSEPMGHLRCFTLKALKEILELHGFKIIAIKGSAVGYFPFYMNFFDKILSLIPSLASDLVVVAKKK